jgi:superfamily II DNA or RNA helicase
MIMREDSLHKRAKALLRSYGQKSGNTKVTERQVDVLSGRAAQLVMGLRRPGMMLLDDPVGTGKTPVSLCVAKLLFEHAEIDYALVVSPSDRVAKIWHERAKLLGLLPDDERKSSGTKRWRRGRIVVSTQRTVPGGIYQDQDPARTLVIIDEAHRGLSHEETEAFKAIKPLAQGTRVLLVTATPLQISPNGFLNMLTVG